MLRMKKVDLIEFKDLKVGESGLFGNAATKSLVRLLRAHHAEPHLGVAAVAIGPNLPGKGGPAVVDADAVKGWHGVRDQDLEIEVSPDAMQTGDFDFDPQARTPGLVRITRGGPELIVSNGANALWYLSLKDFRLSHTHAGEPFWLNAKKYRIVRDNAGSAETVFAFTAA